MLFRISVVFDGLAFALCLASQPGESRMKNAHATENVTERIAEGKYFLIWIGLWIVALLGLLPR
jgi:hypothetical protein